MNRLTEKEADEIIKRAKRGFQDEPGETESPLQRKIVQWANSRGYLVHEHPPSQYHVRAHGGSNWGWADITLGIPGGPLVNGVYLTRGRMLMLELKSRKGTARQSQEDIAKICKFLNIEYYKVRTWKRFMEIIEGG